MIIWWKIQVIINTFLQTNGDEESLSKNSDVIKMGDKEGEVVKKTPKKEMDNPSFS